MTSLDKAPHPPPPPTELPQNIASPLFVPPPLIKISGKIPPHKHVLFGILVLLFQKGGGGGNYERSLSATLCVTVLMFQNGTFQNLAHH